MSSLEGATPAKKAITRLQSSVQFDIPESRLLFAVISQAIRDAQRPKTLDGRTAVDFLTKERVRFAELIGLDSEYLHRVLVEEGLIFRTQVQGFVSKRIMQ